MSYKWYSKNREYSYGDYNKDIKKYFNEDSGKWVSRLNNIIIDEKYIRYEFSYWDEREIEKIFGYDLVERIGRFLFVLYKKGIEIERRRDNRWVYVESSKVCCGILGSRYIEIIAQLKNLGIINIKYGKGKFGKKKELYELNDGFFNEKCERRIVWIRNSRLNRFLDKLYSGELKVGNDRDELIYWEIESCKNVDVVSNSDGVGILLKRRLNNKIELDWEKRDWDFISNKERKKVERGWDDKRRNDYLLNGRLSFNLLKIELDELKRGGFSFDGFGRDDKSGRYDSEVGLKDRFIGKKGYYERELKKLNDRKNKIMNLYLDGDVSEVDYKDWIKNEFEVSKKEIEKKKKGIEGEIVKYGYVDKIDSWMSYMKEEMLKDYYIERREDKRRILDKYVYSVFVKEIIEEDKKRFEIKMGIVLGKERGEVVFDVNKKRLNLKNRNNQFYILNDDLVAGTGLEPVTFGL